ncbi:MAG: hypothetical protein BGN86_07085 [Caulobacterales bacterium 68-7]|nr:MAG: hypothetical protein BGN86_07085 [Caulobacterales bacterium 68-7]
MRTVRETTTAPPSSRQPMSSSMPCMMRGTPAITNTLPIWKPGGPLTGFLIFAPPTGMRAIRRRAALGSSP